jgi:hypothetical protein
MSNFKRSKNLLSISADSKTIKGEKIGYLTGILYLAPANTTKYNTCSMAHKAQCAVACLYSGWIGRNGGQDLADDLNKSLKVTYA